MSPRAPRRRGLLGGAVALLATPALPGTAVPKGHPDAALLAACREYWRMEAIVLAQVGDRTLAGVPFSDPRHHQFELAVEQTSSAWYAAVDALCEHPATTPEGVRAKAEAARRILLRDVCLKIGDGEQGHDFAARATAEQWMILSFLDDMTGRA